MWSHERHSKILDELARYKRLSTNRLAALTGVSNETIRRDFLELEEQGHLKRVHGGAVLNENAIIPEPSFSTRLQTNAHAKMAIGSEAARFIPQGSTVFVDAGTTTLAFARGLMSHRDIRVITNSIEISQLLARSENLQVLLLGGKPHADVPATYGELTLSEVDRFLADYAVISPVAFHPERGATDYALHEAELARRMMKCSKSCIMLCHGEKILTESLVAICRPEEIDHLFTDMTADRSVRLPRGQVHFVNHDETILIE